MRLKTKFSLEVIILITLIGMVSFIAVINTKQVQDSFLDLSAETMPTWDALKDMRFAASMLSASTMDVLFIYDEMSQDENSENISVLEEQLEFEIFELETSKSLFTEAFTKYSILMNENFPESNIFGDDISEAWNGYAISSSKIISMKSRDGSSEQVLELKDEFSNSEQLLNQALFSAVSFIEPQIENRQQIIENLVDNTTIQIIIALNIFIVSTLSIKYLISKSIAKPLNKLRKATHQIAEGNFVKTEISGDDEISELGKDVDQMSTDLQKLNREIVTSERLSSIGSLASRLAHDLRNPLSVIKNSMEIMKLRLNDNMDEKINHQFAMVGRAISRMNHQIEDVLDFVNIADLKMQSTSVNTVLESAVLSTDLPKSLKINMPKNSATILCDPYRLEVVFSNLIKNASQAIDGEGVISMRIIENKVDVVIEVEDSGPGISQENMNHIFEPLFTTKQTGTGLGLASCNSIVTKHGGTISVRNNPTVFMIKLLKVPKRPKKGPQRKIQIEKSILNE
jgi:signal transduction histidine kinase